jgi:transcriptional regulator GlxA family with amidase domain
VRSDRDSVPISAGLRSERTLGEAGVAVHCGFGSTETMRRAFKRVISIGPGEYRDRFRCAELATP